MTVMIVAAYPSFAEAQVAVERALHMGVDSAAISILYADYTQEQLTERSVGHFEPSQAVRLSEEVSPALGLLLGIGKLQVLEIGTIVAGGPLATALSSIVAINSPDPLNVLLRNAGLSAEERQLYKESLRRGLSLVTVHTTRNQSDHIKATLVQAGAIDLQQQAEAWLAEGWQGSAVADPDMDLAWEESNKLGTIGGTLVGAATGAAAGSFGGPIGTVIGSVAGAISGGAIGAASDMASDAASEQEEVNTLDESQRDQV